MPEFMKKKVILIYSVRTNNKTEILPCYSKLLDIWSNGINQEWEKHLCDFRTKQAYISLSQGSKQEVDMKNICYYIH